MNGHAVGTDVLSRDELLALSGYEQTIERGLNTYIEVGTALGQVREQRLYRAQYASFQAYCATRWGFTGRRGNQLIEAAEVGRILPIANAGQAAALAAVPEPERAEVLAEATERSGGKPTAKTITEVANERADGPTPPADLRAEVLKRLPAHGSEGLTIMRLSKLIPGSTTSSVRRVIVELVKSGEAKQMPGEHADRYTLAPPPRDLRPDVERVLRSHGADGATEWKVAFLLQTPKDTAPVAAALHALAAAGRILVVGHVGGEQGGALWALTELLPKTPGTVGAAQGPPAVPGPTPEPVAAAPADSGTPVPAADGCPAPAAPPQGSDPVTSVAAALAEHVPDPGKPQREWQQEFAERLKPIGSLTLWLDVEKAAEYADEHDVETLRQLSLSFTDLHRRVVAARTATVTPLRRIK